MIANSGFRTLPSRPFILLVRRNESTAKEVIAKYLNRKSRHPIESTDILSPTQSSLLSLTLQPYLPFRLPPAGGVLPQGHHLVYFPTAAVHESCLAPDGTEAMFSPGDPFTRRMWAGGAIEWAEHIDLPFISATKEKMELEKMEAKQRSGGSEMIVMSIKKTLYTRNAEEAVRETRQWVFLKDGDVPAVRSEKRVASTDTVLSHPIALTPAALFRYSALLFNSHAIHLSKEHCLKEGHPDLVVHGPLILSLLLETIRASVKGRLRSISYRAVGPAYVGEIVTLNVRPEQDGRRVEAWAEKGRNVPVMTTSVHFW